MANSDSDTSINMNIIDNLGDKINITNKVIENTNLKKPESSDTDYYLNLIANPDKINEDSEKDSSTSSISDILENSEENKSESSKSSKSSSRASYKKVDLSTKSDSNDSDSKQQVPIFDSKPIDSTQPPVNFSSPPVNFSSQQNSVPKKEMPYAELRMKKIELLRKLSEIKAKGFDLSKNYDFNSSIEEMEYEYELLKSFANKRNGVKLYKNILLNSVSAIEFLNDKYDPFDFKLTGWSEHMSVEVDSYDDVIEEIYEKYKGSGKKMAPEIKLLLLIVASGSAFHFSKSTFKNLPGVDKVLQNNPDLIAKMMNPKKQSSQFMSEQEINLEKQKKKIIEKEKSLRRGEPVVNQVNQVPISKPQPKPVQQNIKAPLNVQEILNKLHNNTTETQDDDTSSNNDRIVNSQTLNSSEKRAGRKKKNIIKIET